MISHFVEDDCGVGQAVFLQCSAQMGQFVNQHFLINVAAL
jgi:hypothetical protein